MTTVMLRLDVFVDADGLDAPTLERRATDAVEELVLDLAPRHFTIHSRHHAEADDTPSWNVRWGPRS